MAADHTDVSKTPGDPAASRSAAESGLRRPIALTRLGLVAERLVRAFWPVWTVLLFVLAAIFMGWHETAAVEVLWGAAVLATVALGWFTFQGLRMFRWPSRAEARDHGRAAGRGPCAQAAG